MEATYGSDESLLGHILGILAMAEHAQAKGEHLPLVTLDEHEHGLLIPSQALTHQLDCGCLTADHRFIPHHSSSGTQRRGGRFHHLAKGHSPSLFFFVGWILKKKGLGKRKWFE